jgi:AmiR/NasT family two-component response regulator
MSSNEEVDRDVDADEEEDDVLEVVSKALISISEALMRAVECCSSPDRAEEAFSVADNVFTALHKAITTDKVIAMAVGATTDVIQYIVTLTSYHIESSEIVAKGLDIMLYLVKPINEDASHIAQCAKALGNVGACEVVVVALSTHLLNPDILEKV